MKGTVLTIFFLVVLLIPGCTPDPETSTGKPVTTLSTPPPSITSASQPLTITASKPIPSLKLEDHNGEIFSMKKPVGWDVATAGACSTFSFHIYDKENPANQIFFFGEAGPVYLADEQKAIDRDYMDMGGFPVLWLEMPVINPLTPENFITNFHLIAETDIAKAFMTDFPGLNDIEIISVSEEETFIPGGQTKTIRALFRQSGQLGEGLFYITVAPLIPLSGMPGGGIGYGFCFTGITAERDKFKFYEDKLQESLNSLTFARQYIDDCLAAQQQQGAALLDIGKTLSETSDIIMDAWDNRSRSDDILSEKRSDVMLGYERVYDPETGTVYETPLGFYDDYNINRDKYNMDDLQLLPEDDWNLWTAPTEPITEID